MLVALSIGIGVLILAVIISGSICGFILGTDSCPPPDVSIGIGSLMGAITTALFFYFIDKPAKDFVTKFVKPSVGKIPLGMWLTVFVLSVTAISLVISTLTCGSAFDNFSCPPPDVEIWIGAIIGVLTTALFFFMINRRVKTVLEQLGKLYIARTCVLNLMDIFGKENGKGRIKKSEKNRQYFLKVLKEDYIDRFSISNSLILDIYQTAKDHKLVETDHNHVNCTDCNQIMKLIKQFNEEEKNIIEGDKEVEKIDWINKP